MDTFDLRTLLERVAAGSLSVDEAAEAVQRASSFAWGGEDLGFARIDHARAARQGFPEVIFGQGKTPAQIARIAERIVAQGHDLLVTRAAPEAFDAVAAVVPGAHHRPEGRAITFRHNPAEPAAGCVLVVSAGTSDVPVAEEAAITAEVMGNQVDRLFDVGVAGLHRLLSQHRRLMDARVLVVVAGMEGALPSVVGGLVRAPVIAVPTSVGYGASFGGIAALLGMLNSCAAGVAVVNIDNGFGAGALASRINRVLG